MGGFFILLTAQHILDLYNVDIRAEPFTDSLSQVFIAFINPLEKKWFLHLVMAPLFAACAVMRIHRVLLP